VSPRRSRPLTVTFVAVLLAVLAMAPTVASGDEHRPALPDAADPGDDADATAITLITGDVVTYVQTAEGVPSVETAPAPRPDGSEVSFHSYPTEDGFVVIPDDVIGLVAAGTLDEALFDIPTLLDEQAGDPDGSIHLLIEYPQADEPAEVSRSLQTLAGGNAVLTLSSIDAAAIEIPSADATGFWTDLTDPEGRALTLDTGAQGTAASTSAPRIWLDRTMTATLDRSAEQVGATAAWDLGLDGTGVTVAVLDTGIDPEHPDFKERIVGTADFSGKGDATDGHGHGTHVAGTVLGDGAASDGRFTGVAPGADLLVAKVLGDDGSGLTSQVIAGMEWAVANGADVVNLSLSAGGGPTDGSDPASRALDALSESSGALFVVAAGNAGAPLTVRAPGAATHALTVGAVDHDDVLAGFSSAGPRGGDAAIKPNLVAPGVAIAAARATGTDGQEPIDPWYTRVSGTSMAAPHVAGAATILAQQHPDWDAEQIRDALIATAIPADDPWFVQGGGRLDIASALASPVQISTSLDLGQLDPTDGRATEEVTVTNTGDQRLTLDVSIEEFHGWSGAPGPSGAVNAVPKRLTIPAGATRTVRVRVDPRQGDAGAYGGYLTVGSGDGEVQLSVPFSYYTGAAHRVDFAGRSADGTSENPVNTMGVLVVALSEPVSPEEPFGIESQFVALDVTADGGALHLAEGDYQAIGLFSDVRRDRTEIVLERFSVTAPKQLLLDAADARPIAPEVPEQVDLRGQQSVLLLDVDGDDDPFWLRSTGSVSRVGGIMVTPTGDAGLRFAAQSHAEPAAVTEMRTSTGARYGPSYHVDSIRRMIGDGGTFEVVSVGAGDPSDYAGLDVRGKVVVIAVPVDADAASPTHAAFFDLFPRAGLATGMGAAGVVAYLDHGDDPGGYVWNFGALPVLSLPAVDGRALAQAASDGPVEVTITGNGAPDAIYRLRTDHDGGIPETGGSFGSDDLLRVDAAYHADQPGTATTDTWASTTGDGFQSLMPPAATFTAPRERTEYLGPAANGVTWHRQVQQGPLALRSLRTLDADDAGATDDEVWFKAPLLPGAATVPTTGALPEAGPMPWLPSEPPCALCRDGDRFVPALHWLGSDWRHAGDLTDPQVELFRDDSPVALLDGHPPSFIVPDDTADYRVVASAVPPGRTMSSLVTTVTEFRSSPATGRPDGFACSFALDCEFQPAPQLRYDLPLDLLNRAPAGDPYGFEVAGATAAGEPIHALTMWYSVDGGDTWIDADVMTLGGGRFSVEVENPAVGAGDGYVALRASATDAEGNTIDQTILRAYAVD
jgi:subtilisin family serine protease